MTDRAPTCPHARRVEGSSAGQGGVVCGVMERDAARADRILEGAPVGVFIRASENPSVLANLCFGTGAPVTTPEDLVDRAYGEGHYTGCPVFCADREFTLLGRLYAYERPDPEPDAPGVTLEEPEVEIHG